MIRIYPRLALSVLVLNICACSSRTEFVLNPSFEGPAVIVYDDPKGVALETRMKVPSGGILYVRGSPADRSRLDFFTTASPSRSLNFQDRDGNSFQVFGFVSSEGVEDPAGMAVRVKYDSFLVGVPNTKNDWEERRADKIKSALVELALHRGLHDLAKHLAESPASEFRTP